MSMYKSAFEASSTPSQLSKSAPTRILISLVILIFLAEIVAMAVLYFLPLHDYFFESLLDGLIMIVLILPVLYFLQLKPISSQVYAREKADEAVRKNEKLLRNVLEMMPVGVWLTDAKGKIIHGNPRSVEIWGGARYVGVDQYSEYKGWRLETGKIIAPEEWAAVRAINYGETSLNEEIEIESFDGVHKIILNSAKPIYDDNHVIAGAIIVNQDITELKQAQQAVAERVALFSTAMENMPVGVWLTDGTGKIIYSNPAGQQIWAGARYVGMDQFGEYKGWWLDTGKLIQPDEWAVARAINKGETSLNEEIEIECFDGTHKIILNSAIPVWDEQGKILWSFILNQDITERKRHEQVLKQTNELLERFFARITSQIAYMDRDFNIIRVNESYAASAGHPPEFFPGKNHFELYPHPENEVIFREVVETGVPYSVTEKPFEYAEYPERGVTYWDWSLQPVKGSDGDVQGVVLSLADVTERKRAELQLAQQNEELRKLSIAESQQREFAEILSAATQTLTQTLNLEQVINTLLAYFQTIVHSDTISIILLEDEDRVVSRVTRGFGSWAGCEDIPFVPVEGKAMEFIQHIKLAGGSTIIQGRASSYSAEDDAGCINSWLVVPIIVGDNIIGWVELGKADSGLFTQEEREWAEALVGPAAIGIENALLFEQLQSSSSMLHSLTYKLVEIQERERYAIARELHDEAGQALSSLKLSLGRLEQDKECTPRLQKRLHELKDLTDDVLEDIHQMAMNLRPAVLDHLGLVAALEQLATNLDSEELSVTFKAVGFEEKRLPNDIETALYRIIQEATSNVVRHAQASNISVLLEWSASKIKAFIEDDGVGFAYAPNAVSDRLGLVGMRERAEMFGGCLTVESSSGRGTSIIVEVPYDDSNSYRG